MKAALLIFRRFLAFGVDWLLFGLASLPIVLYLWHSGADETAMARMQTVLLWVWFIYYAGFEWFYGATVGKFVFGLAVRRTDGTDLAPLGAIGRVGLTFIMPCVFSVWIFDAANFFESYLAGYIATTLSMAILAAIPLSIIFFAGQSVADVLLRTCVIPAGAAAKNEAIGAKRWIFVGVTSVLAGFSFTWMTTAAERMLFGDTNVQTHNFINTFPPDLLPQDRPTLAERKMIMDFQGIFVRQRQKSDPEKSIDITMDGSATSFDEMVGLRLLATRMAELPDEERPKCVTISFGKDFEAVFASFVQRHEWMVCDVPKGLPQQATIIDRRQSASWQIKYNTITLLPILLGRSDGSVRRFVPTAKNTQSN